MLKRIFKIVILCIMFVVLLSLGGYTFSSFSTEIHLKNPSTVLSPLFSEMKTLVTNFTNNNIKPVVADGSGNSDTTNLDGTTSDGTNPDGTLIADAGSDGNGNTGGNGSTGSGNGGFSLSNPGLPPVDNSNNPYIDENGNLIKQDIQLGSGMTDNGLPARKFELSTEHKIKVAIDGKEIELSNDNTIDFIKWLNNTYTAGAKVSFDVQTKDGETINSGGISAGISTDFSKPDGEKPNKEDIKYNDILETPNDLSYIIASIEVIDELPVVDTYDRAEFEKPVHSYKIDGVKYNRNDYAWMTSQYLVSNEPFEYYCPYTGQTITDDSKLDYDHLVPLKSAYRRGADQWTAEQLNAYAYDQWIGVDVLYSANRSKGDKGPLEWMPTENQEDYCYSWLIICSYYDLAMTDEEIEFCTSVISEAIQNGETVEHMCGPEHTFN